MSENSIEFSLSNSEQRDSWLNSSHQTLDTDREEVEKDGRRKGSAPCKGRSTAKRVEEKFVGGFEEEG